jgi:hypothetical protein
MIDARCDAGEEFVILALGPRFLGSHKQETTFEGLVVSPQAKWGRLGHRLPLVKYLVS